MASGDTLAEFGPADHVPNATAYPTLGMRNNHPTLDYDDTADEAAEFSRVLPTNYAGGDLDVVIGYMAASATSGVVRWRAQLESHTPAADDLNSDSFAGYTALDSTTAGTSGQIKEATITLTGAALDSIAAGEEFRLEIQRQGSSINDTMTGDAQLKYIHVKEA